MPRQTDTSLLFTGRAVLIVTVAVFALGVLVGAWIG